MWGKKLGFISYMGAFYTRKKISVIMVFVLNMYKLHLVIRSGLLVAIRHFFKKTDKDLQ